MTEISVALLTYNGEKYLGQVLEMIRRQKQQPAEVVAIDSGSTDSTLKILRDFDVSVHPIPQSEFSHSRTRNLAAQLCSGKYLVFLTQDATPADNCWLDCLIRPFQQHPNVAGTFSRQIPRPGASLLEANDIRLDFPPIRSVKTMENPGKNFWQLIKFSNSSAAYDRGLLLQHPFDERLEMAEDQERAWRMLQQGFTLVYEPDSVVLHSHEHSLEEKYQRSLKMGESFSRFLQPQMGKRSTILESGAWLYHQFLDLQYANRCDAPFAAKIKWLVRSPVHRAVVHYAYRKGWNSALPFPAQSPAEFV